MKDFLNFEEEPFFFFFFFFFLGTLKSPVFIDFFRGRQRQNWW